MKLPQIIQGGMGVAISDWTLAKSVSSAGQLGVVSGTGIALVMLSRLAEGDSGGHIRRALSHFPFQDAVQPVLDKYFVAKPSNSVEAKPYKRPPMWTLKPARALQELTVISNFVEVFLAKEGHNNPVGLNLLEKIQLPTMASLYGAMLAKIDVVIMGAGIPLQIPGILDSLANHDNVSYNIDVENASKEDTYQLDFKPLELFPTAKNQIPELFRPHFLPVVSSPVLAKAMITRATGKVDGFIVEMPLAGGHNAPPRGKMQLNDLGEPIYGAKDEVNLQKIKELGLPFWVAGGYDSPQELRLAQDAGATGVQVGTAFAYCNESGLDTDLKQRVITKVLEDDIKVRTDPLVSPTQYPFKVVALENTLSEAAIYQQRKRLCDIGMLRRPYKTTDGKVGFRCPAEPVEQYLAKDGSLEDTVAKQCLCNNLCATAGFPQHRKDGYVEAPLITSGDRLVDIGKYLQDGKRSYSAVEVLNYLLP